MGSVLRGLVVVVGLRLDSCAAPLPVEDGEPTIPTPTCTKLDIFISRPLASFVRITELFSTQICGCVTSSM